MSGTPEVKIHSGAKTYVCNCGENSFTKHVSYECEKCGDIHPENKVAKHFLDSKISICPGCHRAIYDDAAERGICYDCERKTLGD